MGHHHPADFFHPVFNMIFICDACNNVIDFSGHSVVSLPLQGSCKDEVKKMIRSD